MTKKKKTILTIIFTIVLVLGVFAIPESIIRIVKDNNSSNIGILITGITFIIGGAIGLIIILPKPIISDERKVELDIESFHKEKDNKKLTKQNKNKNMNNFEFKTYGYKEYMLVRDIYIKSGKQNKEAYNSLFIQFRKHIEDDQLLKRKYDLKYLPWTWQEFHGIQSKLFINRKIVLKELNQFFYSLESKESFLNRIDLSEYKKEFVPDYEHRFPNDEIEMSLFKQYVDLIGPLKDYEFINSPLIKAKKEKDSGNTYVYSGSNNLNAEDCLQNQKDDEYLKKKYFLKKLPWEEHNIYAYMANKSLLEKDIFLEELEDEENESLDEDD